MRAVVDAKEFSKALDKVSSILRKSKFDYILEEAMVCFSDGRCTVTGTDFETWLTTEIPAYGNDFAFVFHRTASVVKACRRFDGELTIELTETGEDRSRQLRLCMICGDRMGEFHAFFPEEYPELPELEPECSFTANAASLFERIDHIKYATREPAHEVAVQRSSIQFVGSRIYCLDGFRAAWSTDENLPVPRPFMVPAAPLAHLKAFGGQDVTVKISKRHIVIENESLRLVLRQVEAELFDLDSAIPSQFREEIYVSPNEFLSEVAYLKDLIPGRKMVPFCFNRGKLSVQVDECRYQTKVRLDGHSEVVIGLSLRNMTEALRQFKGEPRVRMRLNSPVSPIILDAEGRNDCAMVLPVRLKQRAAAA